MQHFAMQASADAVSDQHLLHRVYCQELPATLDYEFAAMVRPLGLLSLPQGLHCALTNVM